MWLQINAKSNLGRFLILLAEILCPVKDNQILEVWIKILEANLIPILSVKVLNRRCISLRIIESCSEINCQSVPLYIENIANIVNIENCSAQNTLLKIGDIAYCKMQNIIILLKHFAAPFRISYTYLNPVQRLIANV